jgi:hypothetical protein
MDFAVSRIGRDGESIDTYCFPRFNAGRTGSREGRHGQRRYVFFRSIIDVDIPFFPSSLKDLLIGILAKSNCGMLYGTVLRMRLRIAISRLLMLLV